MADKVRDSIGDRIYRLLEEQPRETEAEKWFDRGSVVVVLAGWIMAAITSVSTIRQTTFHILSVLIWLIIALVLIEYVVRVWASGFNPDTRYRPVVERVRHALWSINVLDPVCVALCVYGMLTHQPEFLTAGFTFRVFRIFRFSKADDVLWTILKRNFQPILTVLTLWSVFIMAGAGLMYAFENRAQPDKFDNIFQCLYYMLVTFTTTGYGDLYPVTPLGKVVAAVTMIVSAGLLGGIPIGIVAGEFIAVRNEKYAGKSSPLEPGD